MTQVREGKNPFEMSDQYCGP